jgi:hypothetical protein
MRDENEEETVAGIVRNGEAKFDRERKWDWESDEVTVEKKAQIFQKWI